MASAAWGLPANALAGRGSLQSRLAADKLRPQFHLMPAANWMNDPNGPIFYRGRYHMFFQYNPNGAFWGSMHWAHATSPDMIHWQHEPLAIAPTPNDGTAMACSAGVPCSTRRRRRRFTRECCPPSSACRNYAGRRVTTMARGTVPGGCKGSGIAGLGKIGRADYLTAAGAHGDHRVPRPRGVEGRQRVAAHVGVGRQRQRWSGTALRIARSAALDVPASVD